MPMGTWRAWEVVWSQQATTCSDARRASACPLSRCALTATSRRSGMTPTEMAEAVEYVDILAHEVDCVMWIDWFWVPRELRGRSVGRAAFESFVRDLDPG